MRDDELHWMRRALELAAQAEGRTSPNPLVGAVVVRNGVCVGEGFHPKAGEPHAEVFALRESDEQARDATIYVTLEPCSHFGRTPPCADLLIERKIRRVVSAMEDPDRRVAGRGHERLREAGVTVEIGVLEAEATRLNAAYLKWKRTGLPLVTLKLAMSLDGKIATRTGESQWITGEAARLEGHRLRNTHDAILVGVGTALADNPRLTTRLPAEEDSRDPLRVILDTEARTPVSANVLTTASPAKTVIAVADDANPERLTALEQGGAVVWRVPRGSGGVEIVAVLERLGAEGVLSVLVEGGSRIHGSFVAQRLADRVRVFLAPMFIGGQEAPSGIGGEGIARLSEALRLRDWRIRPLGPDICIEADCES